MKIQLLNKIAKIGTDRFDKSFTVAQDIENPDAIMVRSAAMHDMEFGDNLLAIARAGAGVNNIPLERCAKDGIVVFNTPGANANGVKELCVAALILASRDIAGGIAWAKELPGVEGGVAKAVEAGKSKFAGHEILGKKLGVIGLGAIGGLVANTGQLHAQADETTIIIHQATVFPGSGPIQQIHFAAGAVAVFDAALGSSEFLTGQEEGSALAAEVNGCSQTVCPQNFRLTA